MLKKYLTLLLLTFIFHNSVYSAAPKKEIYSTHMLGVKQSDFKTGFIAVKKAKKYLKKKKLRKLTKNLTKL